MLFFCLCLGLAWESECHCYPQSCITLKCQLVSKSNLRKAFSKKVFWKTHFASAKILFSSFLKIRNKIPPRNYFKLENKMVLCIFKINKL